MCFRGKGGLGGPPHVQPGNVHLCIPLVRDHVCVCAGGPGDHPVVLHSQKH